MGTVVKADFLKDKEAIKYSADVYSEEMNKYQFQTIARSIGEALDTFMAEASDYSIKQVKCIAIYTGNIRDRSVGQSPEKVYQNRAIVHGLVEC